MAVSEEKRRQALLKHGDIARLERAGRIVVVRTLLKALSGALRLYRRGEDPIEWVLKQLLELQDPLARLMAGARLAALRRNALVLDAITDAQRFFSRKLGMNNTEIRALVGSYSGTAASTTQNLVITVERKLTKSLLDITQRNLHVKEGVKELTKAFEAAGIHPRNSFHVEAVYRTQTRNAYEAAHWQSNQEDELIQELLWGYTYVTVGDDRVRPEHEALDGVTAPKDDPIWQRIWPPNGWACRCQVVEVWNDDPKSERKIVLPKQSVTVDGKTVVPGPDRGFGYNPGELFTVTK